MRQIHPSDMRDWARHAHGSPLYAHLSEVVARSDELLRVINRIENLPQANVLFAAVQFLLFRTPESHLADFYRSLTAAPSPPGEVDELFEEFVLVHEEEIVDLGRSRYTQTNECRRCTALLPAIWSTGFTEFHLVDIGTSAGVNLLVDEYRYRWGGTEWGPASSPLLLETELRGEEPVPSDIAVLTRTGLDLHPIAAGDPDDRMWLQALIWPEHVERRRRLETALDMAGGAQIEMIAGSALDTLGPVLANLPSGEPAIVMNSFALNQFRSDQRQEIDRIVGLERRQRRVARVWFEHLERDDTWQTIGFDTGSGPQEIGQGHPHGEWVELYARP